jgi:hypothetical protein
MNIRPHIGPPEPVQDRAREAEIRRLRHLGWSIDGIARHLSLSRVVVERVIIGTRSTQ